MQTKITIRNEAQRCYIDIEGTIGVSEECQWESADNRVATFERLRQEVKRIAEINADEVIVNIRSTGGDVNDALLIYDALRGIDAHITTRCYGYTASAATIIAQAADEGARELSANSLYLIHSATCSIDGNSHSLASRAELLRKTDERLAELYALHSGGDAEFYATLMAENQGEGRWLTAEEAIEAGLADAIIDDEAEGDIAAESVESVEQTTEEEAEEPMPQNVAKNEKKGKRGGRTIAGGIIHYLLKRLAYRIEEWLDNLREKRAAKRAEKEQAEQEPATEPDEGTAAEPHEAPKQRRRTRRKRAEKVNTEESAEQSTQTSEQPSHDTAEATEATDTADTAEKETAAEKGSMPQASVIPSTASVITLRQRQSRYKRTAVKDCEDPAMASVTALANDKAYEEDARQMSQR
ncbi:MAG: Clp protease ClpP [Rikenellaceae bacterium]|nr:Clp protease ClpP [Rikenellaceae bacterium]